jgi:hypothetical protein
MATALWRYDYVKLVITSPRGTFDQYYSALRDAARSRKWGNAEWDKSHKVQALYTQDTSWERTAIDIWGECAGVLELLPYHIWEAFLQRVDVRAVQWEVSEEAILHTGQRMQRTIASRNIEVFSSKPASKRLGRDRGGKGFRIGSRKSDWCIVMYKRTSEPAAVEYRLTGQGLRNARTHMDETYYTGNPDCSLWPELKQYIVERGDKKFQSAMEEAGIGTYWPAYAALDDSDYEALQSSFLFSARQQDADDHSPAHWSLVEQAIDGLAPDGGPDNG